MPRLVLTALTLACVAALANAQISIEGARLHQSPEHTRFVLDLSGPPDYELFLLHHPERVVVDIHRARISGVAELGGLPVEETRIVDVRYGTRGSTVRVVLDLERQVRPNSFTLRPVGPYGDRLVVDLHPLEAPVEPIKASRATSARDLRDVVVAIDAGHGGEDPGAIGIEGIVEKKVVFDMAKELAVLFNRTAGYRAVLLRDGDYYVKLRRRIELAKKARADLFVSIHADAFRSPLAKGASVYALSEQGATSETARWLAEKENRSDLIGGVEDVSLVDKDDLLVEVLLDLSMTHTMRQSLDMGKQVIGELDGKVGLHSRKVELANFMVLKSPDIPSILIETGYLSNPNEARRLATRQYQRQMARGMHRGILRFVESSPPPGTLLAWRNANDGDAIRYVIVKGDTLSGIATRFRVSQGTLRQLNGLATDMIRIGQVLLIPPS
jgi:N-acetylmuramoyl-L-alanine amidase